MLPDFDARRGALLAASSDGVSLRTAAGWRLLCSLPVAMELGEDGGQLGVDPLADALVLVDEARLWSAPLASLDTSAAVVPTSPMRRSRRAPGKDLSAVDGSATAVTIGRDRRPRPSAAGAVIPPGAMASRRNEQ